MRRHVLRLFATAALAGGGLLAVGVPAQAGVVTGHGFASVVQTPTRTCGNAVAVDGVAITACDGWAVTVSGGTWTWEWPDDVVGGPMASIASRTWS